MSYEIKGKPRQSNEINIRDLKHLSDRDLLFLIGNYVDFEKTYFGLASEHGMARQHELDNTLHSLSEGFEIITKYFTTCGMNTSCHII